MDKAKKALLKIVSFITFAAATAFFWGATEAIINRFWPPFYTWQPDRLLESAYGRSVFYGSLVLTVIIIAGVVAAAKKHQTARNNAGGKTPPRRGAVAAAAVLASSLGWFVAGRFVPRQLDLGFATWAFDDVGPFLGYWAVFALLGVVGALALRRYVVGRSWWAAAGRVLRVAGAVGFVALVAARWAEATLRPVAHGPNVVLVVLDAWRADAFRDSLTPHLHEYAESNAIIYRRAWSAASWTTPSMGSVFTGQYVDTHVARSGPRADVVSPTLAQLFRDAGYETTAFVANRLVDRHSPLTDGFDNFVYWQWPPLLRATCFYYTNWYGPAARTLMERKLGPETSRELTVLLGRYLARPHRRPYFLWVHYMDPHTPYSPPPGYYLPRDEKFIKQYRPKMKGRRFAHHRLYEGECTFVDDLLAPMVLPTLAGDENTIVIFTGDHGEEFWEHDTWAHGKSVYEPAVRVPLFIAAPGESPAKVDTPVSQVDLAPTILALAGLEAPATFQGRPLPLSDGGEEPRPIFVGSEFTRPRKRGPREDAVIVWPYKLIVKHGDMSRPGKYFNLRRDPGELKPLPEDKIAARLRVRIQSWKREVDRQGKAKVSTLDAAGAADLRALGYIE